MGPGLVPLGPFRPSRRRDDANGVVARAMRQRVVLAPFRLARNLQRHHDVIHIEKAVAESSRNGLLACSMGLVRIDQGDDGGSSFELQD